MKSPFRSIRQNLFNEGKLLRYLGYAIGEIALIIIGILFALKINDWNEDKKAKVEFDEYVVKLKIDVQQAITSCEGTIETAKRFALDGSSILPLLKIEQLNEQQTKQFEIGLNRLGAYPELQVRVGLLGQILNGDMVTVGRNSALAKQTIEMESQVELHLEIMSHIFSQIDLGMGNLMKFRGKSNDDLGIELTYDLDELRSSKEFRYTAQQILSRTMAVKTRSEGVLQTLESFLTALEEYE